MMTIGHHQKHAAIVVRIYNVIFMATKLTGVFYAGNAWKGDSKMKFSYRSVFCKVKWSKRI